eukprot:7195911-Prymnesium_polylepis.2
MSLTRSPSRAPAVEVQSGLGGLRGWQMQACVERGGFIPGPPCTPFRRRAGARGRCNGASAAARRVL